MYAIRSYYEKQSGTPDKIRLDSLHTVDYPLLKSEIQAFYQEWDSININKADSIFQDIDRLVLMEKYIMNNLNTFESYEDAMILFDVEPQVQEGGEVIDLSDNITQRIDKLANQYLTISNSTLEETSSSFSVLQWVIILMSIIILVIAIGTAYLLYIVITSYSIHYTKLYECFYHHCITG